MKTPFHGLELITICEGFRDRAYLCSAGQAFGVNRGIAWTWFAKISGGLIDGSDFGCSSSPRQQIIEATLVHKFPDTLVGAG